MNKKVKLVDVTLRDGSHAMSHSFTQEQAVRIAQGLDRAGVEVIEVSHGDGLGGSSMNYGFSATPEMKLIEVVSGVIKRARLGALLIPGKGMFAVGFLMMAHMAEPEKILEQAKIFEAAGADYVNLADSAGYLTEDGVKARISVLTEKLCIPVGFHAHNNLGLAIANSLAAISEGASYIDGSLRGLGAGAGNAQIEVLQAVLQRQGCDSGADFEVLMETAEEEVAPIMRYPQVIDADSLMLGYAGVYSSFLLHAKRASERFGVNTRDILAELGRRKMVGGQEDMIVDVAYELAHNK